MNLPAVIDDDEDPEDALVLELEDAPRRKRLFDFMVRWGHPVWHDDTPPPPPPVHPGRRMPNKSRWRTLTASAARP